MARSVNLRQVEAFKAFVEAQTVSEAAILLGVSQPAISKLLAHFQIESGIKLFERARGRLLLTPGAMRLYEEIQTVFAGLSQIERAIELIHREQEKRLIIGILPALMGPFIRRAVVKFRAAHPDVFLSILSHRTRLIEELLERRQIDVGIASGRLTAPAIISEPLMTSSLVCIMPPRHPLASKRVIHLQHLADMPFIAFSADSETYRLVDKCCRSQGQTLNIVLTASTAQMVAGLVAEGLGVSLVHPLTLDLTRPEVLVRRFMPSIASEFSLCHLKRMPNAKLVEAFVRIVRETESELSSSRFAQH